MIIMRVYLKFVHPKKNLTHSGNRRIEAQTLGECQFILEDIIKEFREAGWKLKKQTLLKVSYNSKTATRDQPCKED